MKGILTLPFLGAKTDEEAMCQVKLHDDHHEFDRLVKRWEQPIRRLCSRMVGDSHRGEDLKQDTFLRLFEKRKDYQPKGRFSTFLWRIALNLCYDELRRQKRRRELLNPIDSDDNNEPGYDPVSECSGPDTRTAELEEGELLRHFEDLKLCRIAEILEIPEGTVNSRMAEALVRLSRILEPKLKNAQDPFASVSPLNLPRESFVL